MGTPTVLSASSIDGNGIRNRQGEDLGKVKDLMIDLTNGSVTYAVVAYGGFLGMGDKLFAVPFEALTVDPENHAFILDVSKENLEEAPGFDKDDWPNFADKQFADSVRGFYIR
jgi:sporulation protein YlmC with PRC-barrel domain